MKRKIFLLGLVFIFSCDYHYEEKIKLVDDIIKNPKDIKQICYQSPFILSDMIKEGLDKNSDTVINTFLKYNREYKILDAWKGKGYTTIIISDTDGNNSAAFQFIKKDKWIFLNITLDSHSHDKW